MTLSTSSTTPANTLGNNFNSTFDKELLELIRTRTGIVVQAHQVDNLHHTVTTAMQHFGYERSASFIESLRTSAHDSPELEFLVEGITVGESYFFRDNGQIDFLRNEYLPKLINKRAQTDKQLRIWSAGCSEGQELYTLAFLLSDLIPDLENWRLHLLGTDINTKTLTTCMRGHYREWSFRNTPQSIRERYFNASDGDYELHEDVRRMARFSYLNLAEDAFPSLLTDTNAIDLIMCRNVFIYFDQNVVKKVLQKFKQCLVPDGILMLGASDLVDNNVPGMETIHDENVFYYRNTIADIPLTSQKTSATEPTPQISSPAPKAISEEKDSKITVNKKLPGQPALSAGDVLQQLREYLAQEKWQAAEETVDRYLTNTEVTAELLVYKATAAANLGRLEQASQLCEQALELDPIDKHAHFLSGIVLTELEQTDMAEAALRKVLFLDAKFLEAHYQLGLLQLRCGNQKQGLKSLKNALKLAEQGNPQYNLHNAPDTTYQRMAEVLRNEIQLHENTSHETTVQVKST